MTAKEMSKKVSIIGAGIGGLAAALRLRQHGFEVDIFEAGSHAGGLASRVRVESYSYDGGPYVVLDKPGLEWSFRELGLDLDKSIPMKRIENIYEVYLPGKLDSIKIFHSLSKTLEGFKEAAPNYNRYVHKMKEIYDRLTPLQRASGPGPWKLIAMGAFREILFLMKSLKSVFIEFGLDDSLKEVLGIWTRVAGQKLEQAPSPLALIPSVIHFHGCFLPISGISEVPEVLFQQAVQQGVRFHFNKKVSKIILSQERRPRVQGIKFEDGLTVGCENILSNSNGVGTYLNLVGQENPFLKSLPLQSPGFCLYLVCKGSLPEFYLQFSLKPDQCRVFISPRSVLGGADEWWEARIIQPLTHSTAAADDPDIQNQLMDEILGEVWWRKGITEFKVLKRRTTKNWAQDFNLYRDSMNPVMTAEFMRRGRIAHRSKDIQGLYLAGSSTHPGQWVSFAAISGILSADLLIHDFESK